MGDGDNASKLANITLDLGSKGQQILSLEVDLRPYPSCQHTHTKLSTHQVTHLQTLKVEIVPKDTDDQPITKTQFQWKLHVQDATATTFTATKEFTNFKATEVPIPWPSMLSGLSHPGHYTVLAELIHGWNELKNKPEGCMLKNVSFQVTCADKYHQVDKNCKPNSSLFIAIWTSVAMAILAAICSAVYIFRQRAVRLYAFRRVR